MPCKKPNDSGSLFQNRSGFMSKNQMILVHFFKIGNVFCPKTKWFWFTFSKLVRFFCKNTNKIGSLFQNWSGFFSKKQIKKSLKFFFHLSKFTLRNKDKSCLVILFRPKRRPALKKMGKMKSYLYTVKQ